MNSFFEPFKTDSNPVAPKENTIIVGYTRITVIKPCLLRVENTKNGCFCDMPTQAVLYRRTNKQSFSYTDKNFTVIVKTEKAEYSVNALNGNVNYVKPLGMNKVTNFHKNNLMGTCRTLDFTRGKTKLTEGVISKDGAALLDDSKTLVLTDGGTVEPREEYGRDYYIFAYGHNYTEAVKDYFFITGNPPLIPRFALGNWWSRYKAYTQDEYIELMERFKAEKIPITVATIDMDWHWVDIYNKFGKESKDSIKTNNIKELFYNTFMPGWTGYTWNTDLFPDYKAFLRYLKEQNMHITVNLHPASGCKFYEEAYPQFAEFMGIDKNSKQQIYFDITDEKFIEGYFKFLHHPYEKLGVDFWWIDWQQGTKTKIDGLDPQWALNYYHFNDKKRDNKRPLILSRFAGAGSHRYPLGFSGDSAQTWKCLEFQPYFTSTASNIGYTWWSHDIGGHTNGRHDDELYLRWVQYGVFSPIMRLHSSSNEFMGKEPWKYHSSVYKLASDAMRFRHKLIPYLYTMNRLTSVNGEPLVKPVYYMFPDKEEAYNTPNGYYFGSELLVYAITNKLDKKINLAGVKAYIPKGRYTDIFTGAVYKGESETVLFRDEGSIPVLAKEGAIIPLLTVTDNNSTDIPKELELLIFRGNSSFTLYEDDGETNEYLNNAFAETVFAVNENNNGLSFVINPSNGDISVLPNSRDYILSFRDITESKEIKISVNGKNKDFVKSTYNGYVSLTLCGILPTDKVEIMLTGVSHLKNRPIKQLESDIISRVQGSNIAKQLLFEKYITKSGNALFPPFIAEPLNELKSLYFE